MRYILFSFILLSISLASNAQKVEVDGVAQVTLPKNAKKLSRTTFEAKTTQNIVSVDVTNAKINQNLYQIDEVLLGFWDVNVSDNDNRSLDAIKKELLEVVRLNKKIEVDNATIRNFKDSEFLMITYHIGATNFIRFYSKTKNHKALNGFIESSIDKREKASTVASELLSGVTIN